MKHLPGEACSAMQHILITATSNYREEKNHKAGLGTLFSPQNTRHLKNNRKAAAALTIRPEAASPSALKKQHQNTEPAWKEKDFKIREIMNCPCQGHTGIKSESWYHQRSLKPEHGNRPTRPSFWVHQHLFKVKFLQIPHTYSNAEGKEGGWWGRETSARTTLSLNDRLTFTSFKTNQIFDLQEPTCRGSKGLLSKLRNIGLP